MRFEIDSTHCSHQSSAAEHEPVDYPEVPSKDFWQNVFLDYYRMIFVTHVNPFSE